jgi:hypothetical protein
VLVGDAVPHPAPVQSVPLAGSTVQVTPLFAGSFVTAAVNACWAVTSRLAVVGAIETEIFWAWTVEAKINETQPINQKFSLRIHLSYLNVGFLLQGIKGFRPVAAEYEGCTFENRCGHPLRANA